MKKYNSAKDTQKHICMVRKTIFKVIFLLVLRLLKHDKTKLSKVEKPLFDIYTPKLKECTYSSDTYKKNLSALKPALDHHYSIERHHPEHFESGIRGMNLVDLLEMLCDWYAATKRHVDGNILKSIEINQNRFGYSDDIASVLKNTVNLFLE